MQKTLIILSLLAFSAFSLATRNNELQVLWSSWKQVHQKFYSPAEEAARFNAFVENYKIILKHNAEHTSHKLGLNVFADLTNEEYRNMLNFKPSDIEYAPEETVYTDVPTSVDWRKKKAVTGVNTQGDCGSCWAFSVTGVLEGMHAIKAGKLEAFSAQQIMDCSNQMGCDGGYIDAGLDYAAQYGLEPTIDYPYTGEFQNCTYNASKAIHINTGHVTVQVNNETAFKAAIATMPTAMAVDGSGSAFQLYTSGVIQNCTSTGVDHSALAVGYGVVDGVEAYYIKNSWGVGWGEHGYVYISTDPSQNSGSGVCGILSMLFIAK